VVIDKEKIEMSPIQIKLVVSDSDGERRYYTTTQAYKARAIRRAMKRGVEFFVQPGGKNPTLVHVRRRDDPFFATDPDGITTNNMEEIMLIDDEFDEFVGFCGGMDEFWERIKIDSFDKLLQRFIAQKLNQG
jgi:hypothetical protein